MGLDTRLRRCSTCKGAPLRALDQQGVPLLSHSTSDAADARLLDQQGSTPEPDRPC